MVKILIMHAVMLFVCYYTVCCNRSTCSSHLYINLFVCSRNQFLGSWTVFLPKMFLMKVMP